MNFKHFAPFLFYCFSEELQWNKVMLWYCDKCRYELLFFTFIAFFFFFFFEELYVVKYRVENVG